MDDSYCEVILLCLSHIVSWPSVVELLGSSGDILPRLLLIVF